MVVAAETTVRKLFEGSSQYQIPLYQRPYQWKEKQWATLWSDVEELVEVRRDGIARTHFIGSLVLTPSPASVAGRVSTHLVVDGQQRLTTLSILLTALRDCAADDGVSDEMLAAQINEEYLVNRFEKDNNHIKLLPTQADRQAYKNVVLRLDSQDAGNRVADAYKFFKDRVLNFVAADNRDHGTPAEASISDLLDTVTEGLSLVSINTRADDNVHRIFQSLNNTGLKLTQGDLLRNYIFMRLPERGQEVYERFWFPMQESLENDQIESLFWLDLANTHPTVKMGDTFFFQQRRLDGLDSEEEIAAEVERFSGLAKLYRLIVSPEFEEDPAVALRLRRLQEIKITVPYPLVLEILRRRRDGEATPAEVARALLVIESFLVRRAFMGKQTQGLNKIFWGAVSELAADKPLDVQVMRWLSSENRNFYTDADVRAALTTAPFYSEVKKYAKTLLQWLEEEYNSKEPVDTRKLSIEHVMPQTLSAEWKQALIDAHPHEDLTQLHRDYVHTLGNLTLTGYNSELSNRGFGWKKQELAKSGIRLSGSVTAQDTWGFAEIQDRTEQLTQLIVDTWPGPSSEADQELSPLWERLVHVVEAMPAGRWAAYGDLAKAIGGGNAHSVGNFLNSRAVKNAHRVLRGDGAVATNSRWVDAEEGRDLRVVLESEGIVFVRNKASNGQKMTAEELQALLPSL